MVTIILHDCLDRQLTYEADSLNGFRSVLNDFGRMFVVMGSLTRILDLAVLFILDLGRTHSVGASPCEAGEASHSGRKKTTFLNGLAIESG